MTADMRPERIQPEGRRAGVLAGELTSVLQSAEEPLTLGELSLRLGRPFRAVAGVLAAACRAETVERIEGGLYTLRLRPALTELLTFVQACEAQWELDDRLGLFAPARGGETS